MDGPLNWCFNEMPRVETTAMIVAPISVAVLKVNL